MFGRAPFSDTPFASLSDASDGPVALIGRGLLAAVATTTLDAVLADQAAGLVFTAEIHPWVLASRA